MKCFILFLAFVALVNAEDWVPKTAEQIKAIRTECLQENPLSEEDINQMKQFQYPDVEPVRKYLLCTAEKLGVFCTHQGYHADRLAKQFKMDFEEPEALSIVEACIDSNEQNSPVDVWAYRGHKCIMASRIGDKIKAYIKKKQESRER